MSSMSFNVTSNSILGKCLAFKSFNKRSKDLFLTPIFLTAMCSANTCSGFFKSRSPNKRPFLSKYFLFTFPSQSVESLCILEISIKALFHSSTSRTLNLEISMKFFCANPLPEPAPPAMNTI